MSNKVVVKYNIKDDVFIVYKTGEVEIKYQGKEEHYPSIRECEKVKGNLLEELYHSNLVLTAKSRCGWKLYKVQNSYYELLPDKSVYLLLPYEAQPLASLPQGAKEVSFEEHPYRRFL